MNRSSFAREKNTKGDPGILGMNDQGWVWPNQKLRSQENVLLCQISDMVDLWCETSVVCRGQVEMSSGAWERDLSWIK